MKIRFDVDDKHFEYETEPMPKERFTILCKLAGAAIAGAVFLGAVHMVGFWAIPWMVGALALVLLVKSMTDSF